MVFSHKVRKILHNLSDRCALNVKELQWLWGGLYVEVGRWSQEYYWDYTLMWAQYYGGLIKVIAIEDMRFWTFEGMVI